MSGHDHDHHHHHDHGHSELSETELRVRALESVLTEKGYVDPTSLDLLIELYEKKIGPRNGIRVVAKAWADPAYDLVHASIVPCLADLLRDLRDGLPAETRGEDNINTVRLVFAAYESARTGQAVVPGAGVRTEAQAASVL